MSGKVKPEQLGAALLYLRASPQQSSLTAPGLPDTLAHWTFTLKHSSFPPFCFFSSFPSFHFLPRVALIASVCRRRVIDHGRPNSATSRPCLDKG